jgi:N-methylhydantoinase A
MSLDQDAALKVVDDNVAAPLNLNRHDAARGILAIMNNNMVGAVRTVSVERGHDPRDFTLVPFGGAGPLHGVALAELLGIKQIMVPPAPGLLCADGLLAADLKAEFTRAMPTPGAIDQAQGDTIANELINNATAWLQEEGIPAPRRDIQARALLRFHGQGGEIAVDWADTPEETESHFKQAHEALYGFILEAQIELVTLRIEAAGRTEPSPRPDLAVGQMPAPVQSQMIHWETGDVDTPIYDRNTLTTGSTLVGPTVITQLDTTTIIPLGWSATVHPSAALLLKKDTA